VVNLLHKLGTHQASAPRGSEAHLHHLPPRHLQRQGRKSSLAFRLIKLTGLVDLVRLSKSADKAQHLLTLPLLTATCWSGRSSTTTTGHLGTCNHERESGRVWLHT